MAKKPLTQAEQWQREQRRAFDALVAAKQTVVGVRASFIGFHNWSDAPPAVGFLSSVHRHVFHVTLELFVHGDDRTLEFFLVQQALTDFLSKRFAGKALSYSCEAYASEIGVWALQTYRKVPMVNVLVSEDNENYGRVQLRAKEASRAEEE